MKRTSVKWRAAAFRVHFDLHNTAGIYSASFLFVLALTGVVVRFDNSIEGYLHKRAVTKKIGRNFASGSGQKAIDADQAVASALNAMPGTRPFLVTLPANPKASYVVVARFPEDLTGGGRSWVNVDQYTGRGVERAEFAHGRDGNVRSIIWNRAIHTGDVYGWWTKTLMSLSSLMLVVQTVTGYFMWWKKLRARQRALEELSVETVG